MDAKTSAAIERLKQNKGLAEALMRSGDGQALLSRLTRDDGGAALNHAAASAARGDTAELSALLRGLLNDPNAAAAMNRLSEKAKQ
jgi:hypothetical protein